MALSLYSLPIMLLSALFFTLTMYLNSSGTVKKLLTYYDKVELNTWAFCQSLKLMLIISKHYPIFQKQNIKMCHIIYASVP